MWWILKKIQGYLTRNWIWLVSFWKKLEFLIWLREVLVCFRLSFWFLWFLLWFFFLLRCSSINKMEPLHGSPNFNTNLTDLISFTMQIWLVSCHFCKSKKTSKKKSSNPNYQSPNNSKKKWLHTRLAEILWQIILKMKKWQAVQYVRKFFVSLHLFLVVVKHFVEIA